MKMLLFFIFTKSMKFVSLSNNFTPPLSILTRSLLWVLIEMNHSHGSFISTRFMLVEPLPVFSCSCACLVVFGYMNECYLR